MGKKVSYYCDNNADGCLKTCNNGRGELSPDWFQVGFMHGGKFHPRREYCSAECMARNHDLSVEGEVAEPKPYAVATDSVGQQVARMAAAPPDSEADTFWMRWFQANTADREAEVENAISELGKLVKNRDALRKAAKVVNMCLEDLSGFLGRRYGVKEERKGEEQD
jgi:hypothetical protein